MSTCKPYHDQASSCATGSLVHGNNDVHPCYGPMQAGPPMLTCTSVPSLRVMFVHSWALSTMAAADIARAIKTNLPNLS